MGVLGTQITIFDQSIWFLVSFYFMSFIMFYFSPMGMIYLGIVTGSVEKKVHFHWLIKGYYTTFLWKQSYHYNYISNYLLTQA